MARVLFVVSSCAVARASLTGQFVNLGSCSCLQADAHLLESVRCNPSNANQTFRIDYPHPGHMAIYSDAFLDAPLCLAVKGLTGNWHDEVQPVLADDYSFANLVFSADPESAEYGHLVNYGTPAPHFYYLSDDIDHGYDTGHYSVISRVAQCNTVGNILHCDGNQPQFDSAFLRFVFVCGTCTYKRPEDVPCGDAPAPAPEPAPTPDPAPTPTPSAGVQIQSTESSLCVDLPGGDTSNGALLWTWECYGGETQQWSFQDGQLVYLPDTSKCLDLLGGDSTNGNKLGIWDCCQGDSQMWGYDPEWGTIYLASSKASDASKCAQISGQRAGDLLVIWDCTIEPNQVWTVVSAIDAESALVV